MTVGNHAINVIEKVVKADLCCSCGLCAGVCPADALTMQIQDNGDLAPTFVQDKCLEECGLCLRVCPFESGVYNPRELNEQLYGEHSNEASKYDPDIGWFTDSFVGYRKDPDLRHLSASGGLLTWCLEELLNKGIVSKVATVRFAPGQEGYFEFFSARTISDLRIAAGSVYQPVSISTVIKEILKSEGEAWAVVGVPCLCSAVQRAKPILKEKVKVIFGLACGMYQNIFYTDLLLAESGVDKKKVASISYRIKNDTGPANNYGFQATDIDGKVGKLIPYKGLPYFLGKNAFFRQNACNFCMDVFAEVADACFMDAWLPEFRENPKGTSLVILRNNVLKKIFLQGQLRGALQVNKINKDRLVLSQIGHVQRKRKHLSVRKNNRDIKNNIGLCWYLERKNWLIQSSLQNKSKLLWGSNLKINGNKRKLFLKMWVLVILVKINSFLDKNSRRMMKIMSTILRRDYK
jgi:coenzyme F420-reducing hydrogenase beta subunit